MTFGPRRARGGVGMTMKALPGARRRNVPSPLGALLREWRAARRMSQLDLAVDAGVSTRIMFGSDQMFWPNAIGLAVQGIEEASFLTEAQKQDIFFNNAAAFYRLA